MNTHAFYILTAYTWEMKRKVFSGQNGVGVNKALGVVAAPEVT